MSKVLDYRKYIIPQNVYTKWYSAYDVHQRIMTQDLVTINTLKEFDERPKAVRAKKGTDFCIKLAQQQDEENPDLVNTWTRTFDFLDESMIIDHEGEHSFRSLSDDKVCFSPALTMSLGVLKETEIITRKVDGIEKHFLELGKYPQSIPDAETCDRLNMEWASGTLSSSCTGRNYSYLKYIGDNCYTLVNMSEYELDGRKFVRTCLDDSKSGENGFDWFEVEPISFEITNWKNLPKYVNERGKRFNAQNFLQLESEKSLTSGMPMSYFVLDTENKEYCQWGLSPARAFLNSSAIADFKQKGYGHKQFIDFSQSGFINEALYLTRPSQKDYIIPPLMQEILTDTFKYCELDSLTVHKNITYCEKDAIGWLKFKYALYNEASQKLTFSKTKPENYNGILFDTETLKKYIINFKVEDLLGIQDYKALNELLRKLQKSDFAIPRDIVNELNLHKLLPQFARDSHFNYISSEIPSVREVFSKIGYNNAVSLFRFISAVGCFSSEKLQDKGGCDTSIIVGQKTSAMIAGLLKENILKGDDYQKIFNPISIEFKATQSFIRFITQRVGRKLINFEMLVNLAEKLEDNCLFDKIMRFFDDVLRYKKSLDERGMPINLGWEEAIINYLSCSHFVGIDKSTNVDIAKLFYERGLSQSLFEQASQMRMLALKHNVPEHILGKPLKEETIPEKIEKIKKETADNLLKCKVLMEKAYKQQFTYEFLNKYDPANAIIGIYCSCCAVINGAYYGKHIAEATILEKDVQNIVIRNAKEEIIAKGAIYVNEREGYAVINDFEVNEAYQSESYNESIFRAFLRAVNDFVDEYDRMHPDNPMKKVVVGDGCNKLVEHCKIFKTMYKPLFVPFRYQFCDAETYQYILYENNNADACVQDVEF